MHVHGPHVFTTTHTVPLRGHGQPSGAQVPNLGSSVAAKSEPVDTIRLSDTAQEIVDGSSVSLARGNSPYSPAHRAHAMIQEHPDLANMPFGKVVSGLIHETITNDVPSPDEIEDEPLANGLQTEGGTLLADAEAPPASVDVNASSEPGPPIVGGDAFVVEASAAEPDESIVEGIELAPTMSGNVALSLIDEMLDGKGEAAGAEPRL